MNVHLFIRLKNRRRLYLIEKKFEALFFFLMFPLEKYHSPIVKVIITFLILKQFEWF